LKNWACVQVNHHNDVGSKIEEWERNGWHLHTYTCAQLRGSTVNHYLLFEIEDSKKPSTTEVAAAAAAAAASAT
jgi:hypothetical protein